MNRGIRPRLGSGRWAAGIVGFAMLVAGTVFVLDVGFARTPSGETDRARALPTRVEIIDLLGPLRGIPVPFLWSMIGHAGAQQNPRARRAPARLLTWFLPERPDVLYDLAWRRTYDDASLEEGAEAQVDSLLDALDLLDEAARNDPSDGTPLAWQGFHLVTRCADQEGAAARRRAFEQKTGIDPLELADRLLERAAERSDGIDWVRWQRATALETLAVGATTRGADADAAEYLVQAAELWADVEPGRAALLRRLAVAIRDGNQDPAKRLSRSDRSALAADFVFGRDASLWLDRIPSQDRD
ncbi:MAG: hypothetical protein KDC95_23815 [Planctomycetes bacterium]|nr:hypothetical protein [Planctomycetota bacterium]